MKRTPQPSNILPSPPRRQFLQGLAAGGVLLGASALTTPAWARPQTQARGETNTGTAAVLTGTEFDLIIAETRVNFTGAPRMATTINGSLPAPTLRWREGDTVTIRVTNRLLENTSVHWHGIILPYQQDGVPGISFMGLGIKPGETYTYSFKVVQTGTYWYHSHSGMQEQTGMYGAIIIDPIGADPIKADRDYAERDYIVQLSDWSDENPERVFTKLRIQSDYYNFNQPSAVDFIRDVAKDGFKAALNKRKMWNEMRMNPTDLADISGYTYTYLTNGVTPAGNWTGIFRPGEKVRLRLINSGAMTFFDVRIPGLKMTVVQADGQDVEPVIVDEIRIGVAETYDVIVSPGNEAYTIFAQSMDRTGYARATLAPRLGMTAAIPALDKPEPLTMEDMMGDMGGGSDMAGMDHSKHDMAGMGKSSTEVDHSKHDMATGAALAVASSKVRHAKSEYGPSVDMRVDTPRTNLDDPGVGLRNNGRRVLTYADLHTIGGAMDPRAPEREIEVHITGNMARYTWSLDGLEFGLSTPIMLRYGERVRFILHNDTMMTHPMHLHGLWSELESPDGKFQARKHVINVQPAQRVSFLATADARGRWPFHCHLFLHMDSGMFREVVVV